ncbi:hypothetical protein EKH57_13520 [Halorubrum sp. BOL3-1]|uniref:SipW-dependent-type signal peptide-containing protein n=1 Tax=Halorubrum sp. BOL3-1 TaxID=2497325 RepID=UPI00100521FE|nr:SipW-dependent-type signal peptide-containing protein [Halorubrum sp. BOL3-1]QAU13654.1 hypothetical protein EKH57_13520 [Halorubrum sp. BOL3-1]
MSNDSKYSLSRRKALLGLGTVGVAGAGAGVGTSALFSDEESFEDNQLTAGELNLVVDYETSVDSSNVSAAIDVGQANNGENDGDVSAEYVLGDVKPGDGGFLAFCPKVVDNPAWLWAGSNGLTDSENGLTEPEGEVDFTGGDPGEGSGDLSESIQVTVEYCEYTGASDGDRDDPANYSTLDTLDNPADYTLADLIKDLRSGFLLDGDTTTSGTQAYPSSADSDTQTGPCLCINWEIPSDVGNEIQSDSVEFDIAFSAEQRRNNSDPENPFVDATVGSGSGFDYSTIEGAVNAAGAGDVITVADGTYSTGSTSGVLDVEGLLLEGPNAGIAGSNSGDRGAEAVIEGPLFIGAANICVDGFEIRDTNAGSGGSIPGPGAVQLSVGGGYGTAGSADGTTLSNNVIVAGTNNNASNYGFVLEGTIDVLVTRNLFTEGSNSAGPGATFGSGFEYEFIDNTQQTTDYTWNEGTFSG